MSQPVIAKQDTFADWLTKTNEISANVGDPDNLTTSVKTNVVAAINSISNDPKDRGGLAKDATGKLFADVDDNSIDVSNNNKIQIKNDGVHAKHLNPDVAGPGLRQLQNEAIAIASDELSISTTPRGHVEVKDGGVSTNKLALSDPGTVITWGINRQALALPPGVAGSSLISQGPGLPVAWGAGTGNILGYSGYMTCGTFSVSAVSESDTVEVTVQSTKNLTNITNVEPFPGGVKVTGSSIIGDSTSNSVFYAALTSTPQDANYGFIWQTTEGVVTLRAFDVYSATQNANHSDDGFGARETVIYGMRVFNVDSTTFISFKVKSVSAKLAKQVLKFFFVAELLPNAVTTELTYYTNDGATAIAEWGAGISYTFGDIVKSSNKLYRKENEGTQVSSGSAGPPTHTYYSVGVEFGRGDKNYSGITWKFLGEI